MTRRVPVAIAVVALAFGLAAIVAIYTTAHNSGGQITPAVTVGMVASGVTTPIQALANIAGQFAGALLAVVLLRVLVPHDILKGGHLAGPVVPEHSNFLRAFIGARRALGTTSAASVCTCLRSLTEWLLQPC